MIHVLVGPVGAGKSTHAFALAARENAVRLILDDWMVQLFGDDERPTAGRIAWYQERTRRCLAQIFDLTQQLVGVGTDVVLEVGLIQRDGRAVFLQQLAAAELEFIVWVIDADREVRRERVRRRNTQRGETFAMVVPDEVFELASDMWEPPDDEERARWPIHDLTLT